MEFLLILEILLLAGAAIGVFAMLHIVKGLRTTVRQLEGKVDKLQTDLARQEANLEAVRAVIQSKPTDPFMTVLETVERYRSRGVAAAVALVGVRFVRSYLGRRARQKALPLLDKSTE